MPSFSGQRDKGIRPFQSGTQRVYIHIDPKPTQPILDYGLTELGQITFATPDPEQILVPDRRKFNSWQRVGKIYQPDELQSTDFTTTSNGAGEDDWNDLRKFKIEFVVYNTVGAVLEGTSLQADDAHSWTEKGVLPSCTVVSVSPFGESVNSKSENSESLATGTIQYGNGVIVKTIGFSPIGGSALTKDILDGDTINQQYYSEFFGITTNTASTNPSAVVYGRTDQPSSFTQTDITALSTEGLLDRSYISGNALLVTRSEASSESHGYASLDDIRAGNGAGAFTFVSGYTSNKGPVACAVISEGNIILVGLGGYIYRLTNLTSTPTIVDAGVLTTEDLNDVDYYNNQVVAVGDSNEVLVSNAGGVNGWSSITGPSSGNNLTCVQVVKTNQWYIGTDNGEVWFADYDPNSGSANYTQLNMFGATPTAIQRIKFAEGSNLFGWVVGNGTNLFRTTSAGVRFSNKSPEFARLATVGFTTLAGVVPIDENETFVFGDSGLIGLGN